MNMDHALVKDIMNSGNITVHGQFLRGSNYTFLARVEKENKRVEAVYKPARGEQPLWDFPERSLGKREAAAYEVSRYLGWDLVPPTVYRAKSAPLGPGSLQVFFRHDPLIHFFSLSEEDRRKMLPVCVFDCLVNNADRKGGHILQDEDGHLWCIDQGLCFHTEDKLRTVIWDFAGEEIPGVLLEDVQRMGTGLTRGGDLARSLKSLLEPAEIGALRLRCTAMIQHPFLPVYDHSRRMVPYPPL
jgi:hypothetical protein